MDVFHEIWHQWFSFLGDLSKRKSSILSHGYELRQIFLLHKHNAMKSPQTVELRFNVLYASAVGYSQLHSSAVLPPERESC